MSITIWRIEGQASDDSSAGVEVLYAITCDETEKPDAYKTLAEVAPRYRWDRIDGIVPIASLPTAWRGGYSYGCEATGQLSSLIRQLVERRSTGGGRR
ncbi:MAG TPA: hypothetical protein VH682_03705 [Gemmataceae bacterium]|jgi:hypothetical protein